MIDVDWFVCLFVCLFGLFVWFVVVVVVVELLFCSLFVVVVRSFVRCSFIRARVYMYVLLFLSRACVIVLIARVIDLLARVMYCIIARVCICIIARVCVCVSCVCRVCVVRLLACFASSSRREYGQCVCGGRTAAELPRDPLTDSLGSLRDPLSTLV